MLQNIKNTPTFVLIPTIVYILLYRCFLTDTNEGLETADGPSRMFGDC